MPGRCSGAGKCKESSRSSMILWVSPGVHNQVVGIVCESRINAHPYPFGSITESKIRWWGLPPATRTCASH